MVFRRAVFSGRGVEAFAGFALFLFSAWGVSSLVARAQDPGADAAMQAAQQAAQLSVQATQQANQQMQQAAQTAQQQMQQDAANASTQMPAPRRGLARADKPQFSPRSGKYVAGTTVTLQDDIPKATIFYTTDSSEPTTSSAVYTGPIVLNASMRLRAIAKSPIYSASRVSKANYIVK